MFSWNPNRTRSTICDQGHGPPGGAITQPWHKPVSRASKGEDGAKTIIYCKEKVLLIGWRFSCFLRLIVIGQPKFHRFRAFRTPINYLWEHSLTRSSKKWPKKINKFQTDLNSYNTIIVKVTKPFFVCVIFQIILKSYSIVQSTLLIIQLTIIPRVRMGSESIAHEGERNNLLF